MSAEDPSKGGTSSKSEVSFAERLKQQHAKEHKVTVEDEVDEDDIQHPPPPSAPAESGPAPDHDEVPLSVKAQGKQKAAEVQEDQEVKGQKKQPTLDTKSEELFPALGSGPKGGAAKATWVANKPSGGINGAVTGASVGGPNSHANARPGANGFSAQSRTTAPAVTMPGRTSQRVSFAPSQLLQKDQRKKPFAEVLRDINKRSKAKVEMSHGAAGSIIFEARGPHDDARQALQDVAKEIGSRQVVKIPVPSGLRSHIIGRQGQMIQAMSKRTGAKIQVPKAEEGSRTADEEDDGTTIDIVIEGDAISAESARREIENLVNERTSTVNMRLKDIPAEFYPFIAGPRNAKIDSLTSGKDIQIKVPHYYSWSQQAGPPPSSARNAPPKFTSHPSHHIQISGDRVQVQQARAEIERQVEALRKQIALDELAINRGQHQFIVGNRGETLHDLLEETGCAVILPPDGSDSEMLFVTGPRNKLDAGIDKVMNLATSMQMSNIDIAKQNGNAGQAYARALTSYLQQRRAIQALEEAHSAHIVLPTIADGPMNWEVYAREGKNTIKARSDIINIVNAHPPSRIQHVSVDPFFHSHIRDLHQQRVRKEHGVYLILPEESEHTEKLVIVYGGSELDVPRQRPSSEEIQEFGRILAKVQEEILGIVSGQRPIDIRGVEVPSKFHDKVRKYVRREQQDLPSGQFPCLVTNQAPSAANKKGVSFQVPKEEKLYLRGPEDRLDSLAEKILQFVEAEKRDELERGFTLSFDFPQKFASNLIGKKGDNINKLREEFDVDIQVNDGKVEVKGPKAKAEGAKGRILAMSKKLEDEVTHTIQIEPRYHREMIGAKGSQVTRLEERYNVRVQFPRSRPDDASVNGSEAGGPRSGRAQAANEVIIRGPQRGANEARDELLNLLQWTKDNSHTAVVTVAKDQIPSLIGQGGREMDSIRESTGAKIDVPNSRDAADSNGRVDLKIKGTKQQVEQAQKLLKERSKTFDESISTTIEVDKKYHRDLIGPQGSTIHDIVVKAGGSDQKRDIARTVRVPKQDSADSTIRVEGNKAVVEKIVAAIKTFVAQKENQVTNTIEVAPEKHRLLIGRGGETRQNLESKFSVNVDIPKQTVQGAARSQVKISGEPDNVDKAKDHILNMIKEQQGETIQVPLALHHIVSDNGQFFRRLRNDHRVTVDHAGQQPPKTTTKKAPAPTGEGTSMPLITDEQDSADNYSWEVIHSSPDGGVEGDIPWILRGSPENIAKAKTLLEKALSQAKVPSSTGFLVLPDPRSFKYVVGPGGSQINSIKKQTGCKLTVPRSQAPGDAIEVVGTKESVEQAKDLILDAVKKGGSNRR